MQHVDRATRGLRFASVGVVSVAAAVSQALAQTGEPSEADSALALQEVVVTAQKRTESLQNVPASIQALAGDALAEQHQMQLEDYAKLLPSVSFQEVQPGRANIFMRGVASDNASNQSGTLPLVGLYLDEQPITTVGGAVDLHMYDVARIEALAGPQGTLYGSSSEAGTVRIITNKPDPSAFSAAYDIQGSSVDHGGTGYAVEGYLNIPLGSRAAVRLVGWKEYDPGYIDNVFGTRTFSTGITVNNTPFLKKDANALDTEGGRAALRIDLNDSWTVTPGLIGQRAHGGSTYAFEPSVGDLEVQHFTPESTYDQWYLASLTVQGKIADFDLTYSGGYMNRHVEDKHDYSDYSVFYDQLYGYAQYITNNAGQFIDPIQQIDDLYHYTKQSHELRMTSPADRPLRFVAGLFYENQRAGIIQNFTIPGLASDLSITGYSDSIYLTDEVRKDADTAAFGELSYDLTKDLTLMGGIRGYRAWDALRGFFGYAASYSSSGERSCFAPALVAGSPCTNLNKEESSSGQTHKLNLTYRFAAGKLAYLTYSTGFRPGGVNRKGGVEYQPDYLNNYEFGWKTSWAGDRVRFNGALYREDWNNFQFSFLGAQSFTVIANAAQARIYGVESTLQWLPARGLTLSASGSYNHAVLSEPYCGAVRADGSPVTDCAEPQAPQGQQLPVTPRFKGNASARYEFPLAGVDYFAVGTLSYQTSSWSDLRTEDRAALGEQPAFATFDLDVGATLGSITVDVAAQNMFDNRGQLYRYAECSVCTSETYIRPIRPRTLLLRFAQKF